MSVARAAAAGRLRTVRRLHRERSGAASASDRWFVVYMAALLVSIYVVPTAYLIGTSLDAAAAATLTGQSALPVLNAAFCVVGALCVLLGTVQGPVHLSPFPGHVLLSSDIPRRSVLLRPTLTLLASAAAALAAASAIAGFTMLQTGLWGGAQLGLLMLGTFLAGIQLGLLWFLGQRLGASPRGLVLLILLLCGVLPAAVPGTLWLSPGGWLAMIWTGDQPAPVLALSAVVALLGAGLLAAVPGALGGMPAATVLSQSGRLSDARLYSSAGSIGDAVELFRAGPQHRSHALMRSAVRRGAEGLPGILSTFRADMATGLRVPAQSAGGLCAMTLGTLAAALCFGQAQPGDGQDRDLLLILVPSLLVGTALMHLGSGAVAGGWRSLKDEFDAAPLFGWSSRQALLRRLAWPCAMGLLAAGLGAAAAAGLSALLGGQAAVPGRGAVLFALALMAVVLSARFMQSMRDRRMPLESLVPMPTPFGDLSGLKVLFWVADGLLVSLAAALGMLLLPWPGWAVLLVVAVGGTAVAGWRRTGQLWRAGAPRGAAHEGQD